MGSDRLCLIPQVQVDGLVDPITGDVPDEPPRLVVHDPVRYSCNIVLLMQVPRSYQMTYGVVAWGGTEPSVDVAITC
jgi:hypothetical protein